jgi:hypothetical protein
MSTQLFGVSLVDGYHKPLGQISLVLLHGFHCVESSSETPPAFMPLEIRLLQSRGEYPLDKRVREATVTRKSGCRYQAFKIYSSLLLACTFGFNSTLK